MDPLGVEGDGHKSQGQVLRQLLAESVLLSVLGGALGTLFSMILLNALTRWQPFPEFPIHIAVSPDARVYGVALLLSIESGIVWGLLPAWQIWATDSAQVMKSGGAGAIVLRRFTLRDLLLGVQITLCTLLVTSSFVALRGLQRSLHAPLGFQCEGLLLAETDLHMGGHPDASITQIRKRMLEEVSHIPGVTSLGIVDETPLGTGGSSTPVYREGTADFRVSNSAFGAKLFSISPGCLGPPGHDCLEAATSPGTTMTRRLTSRSSTRLSRAPCSGTPPRSGGVLRWGGVLL